MLKRTSLILAITGALGMSAATMAQAADLFPAAAPLTKERKLEWGTGWYLRGDVSWAREKTPVLGSNNIFAIPRKTSNSWSLGVGAGYKFNSWFRADLTFGYRQQRVRTQISNPFACPTEIRGMTDQLTNLAIGVIAINNQCQAEQTTKFQRGHVLLNGYLDLGTWSGVTPYVGAGAGVAYGRATRTSMWRDTTSGQPYAANLVFPANFPLIFLDPLGNPLNPQPNIQQGEQNQTTRISKGMFSFAWALMAGVAVDVSANAKLDLSYRFLNLGKFRLPGTNTAARNNKIHEYRIGFRYMID